MKKLLLSLLIGFGFVAVSHAAKISVTIGDGSLQPGTTAGFNVSSGTAVHFYASTATLTNSIVTSSTMTRINVTTGTISAFTAVSASSTYASISSATISNFTATSASMTFVTVSTINNNPAMNAHKFTGLAAGAGAGDSLRYEQNKVLQVVSATKSAAFSTTSSTFMIVGLTATITPASTSNNVMVLITGTLTQDTTGQSVYLSVDRNASNVGGSNGMVSLLATAPTGQAPGSIVYLDSPASTSATTYQTVIRASAGTGSFCTANQTCSIILMETAP